MGVGLGGGLLPEYARNGRPLTSRIDSSLRGLSEGERKEDCGNACPFSLADHGGAEALTWLLLWDSKWV